MYYICNVIHIIYIYIYIYCDSPITQQLQNQVPNQQRGLLPQDHWQSSKRPEIHESRLWLQTPKALRTLSCRVTTLWSLWQALKISTTLPLLCGLPEPNVLGGSPTWTTTHDSDLMAKMTVMMYDSHSRKINFDRINTHHDRHRLVSPQGRTIWAIGSGSEHSIGSSELQVHHSVYIFPSEGFHEGTKFPWSL